jgi:peptidyl-prolyl cis-trans isomerase SurA
LILLQTLGALHIWYLLGSPVVMDRVAVVVGRRVVKSSDIDRDLRVSQFLNREPLNFSVDAKRKVAERLIDQELIRQEMMNGGYRQPTEQEANGILQQLVRDRFQGSEPQLRAALSRYGLTREQLSRYFLWQMTVLRFIDERFRPGILVTDEDVRAYYNEHRNELEKGYPQNHSIEALDSKIREIIAGERVNRSFEEWLTQSRGQTRIEYRDAAFREGP